MAFVQNLLVQMQTRFLVMSKGIVAKIEEMGSKIDKLENNINDLKTEMDAEPTVKLNPEKVYLLMNFHKRATMTD